MVDEYPLPTLKPAWEYRVQIPLWSMNTMADDGALTPGKMFRFLYGRWILMILAETITELFSSDSSMVDEYLGSAPFGGLGTMFRFLYGRWIPVAIRHTSAAVIGSDSSMVDEYRTSVLSLFWGDNSSDSSMVDEY